MAGRLIQAALLLAAVLLGVSTALVASQFQIPPLPPAARPLCEPGVTPPPNRFNSTQRLALLRNVMAPDQWYLETGLNTMLSGPQPSEAYRTWISGFTGSNGMLLITHTGAYVFTDSRYSLQADQELDCHWHFYDTNSLLQFVLAYNDTARVRLSVDGRQIRAGDYAALSAANPQRVSMLPLTQNPIDQLWRTDRPAHRSPSIYPLGLAYTGKTWQAKVDQARQKALQEGGADLLFVSGQDETAYLLNLRATVLTTVPYFPSLALISTSQMHLFVANTSQFLTDDALRLHLNLTSSGTSGPGSLVSVSLHAIDQLISIANASVVDNNTKVWLDDSSCSYLYLTAFERGSLIRRRTPLMEAKAVKNSVERAVFARCSLEDSAALVAFLSQLEDRMHRGEVMTELSASELLETYRAKVNDFRGVSFVTIAASGPNAAVIHYRPTATTDRQLKNTEPFLLDSGGQFLGCTTDVTRTLYYGDNPPDEVRDAYTRVLMGVIDLFNLTWPRPLHSRNMDPFARHNLWAVGKDYSHGTGHGIGLFLGVHEGPNGIGRDLALVEGNFQSIEPGFYQREAANVLGFGIRLETITGVRAQGTFLRFEPVTWVPFERKLIKLELLSEDQLRWLNWYHPECRKRLPAALRQIGEDQAASAWLNAATDPIVLRKSAASNLGGSCWMASGIAAALMAWLVARVGQC